MEEQGCRFTVVQILRSTPLPGTAPNTTTGMPCTSQELWLKYSVGLAHGMPSCLHTVGRCFFLLRASPVFNSYLSREHLALTEVHPEAHFWYCNWGQAWLMQPHSWPRGIPGRNTFLLWFSSALLGIRWKAQLWPGPGDSLVHSKKWNIFNLFSPRLPHYNALTWLLFLHISWDKLWFGPLKHLSSLIRGKIFVWLFSLHSSTDKGKHSTHAETKD